MCRHVVNDCEQCKGDFKKGLATYKFEVINLIHLLRNLCLTKVSKTCGAK